MEGQFTQIRNDISRLDQKLDQKISELRSYVDQRFTQVDGTLRLHNWMLGDNPCLSCRRLLQSVQPWCQDSLNSSDFYFDDIVNRGVFDRADYTGEFTLN